MKNGYKLLWVYIFNVDIMCICMYNFKIIFFLVNIFFLYYNVFYYKLKFFF